ncbi:hypothetical protein SAMD00019534_094790 [Acytostelium subglobosum LB1]|uniref:hypothetical protein n=1 Tax=Acytostelium subglobosum LB1 TaxID=1410327 RepID=UPI000645231A|nr:hypothetical protein SAMD00019534_094790 [Acytostelium subglobosum LB1]GAM26304.1 hypothetical protein SAMD00019534_094790 [Acytostelium subglobosum LB1]|eukprot:XP_012750858.1 hypothetical protein SAMD00019534_094790 [Acytostelium subglobosum LB1]
MDEQFIINSRLIDAAKRGEEESLEAFILDPENKVNINAKDAIGQTALMWAAKNGYDDIIRILIKYRAGLNVQDPLGETAAHKAAYKDNVPCIKALVDTGKIDLTLQNKNGQTPLNLAKSEEARKLLVPKAVYTSDDEDESDPEDSDNE